MLMICMYLFTYLLMESVRAAPIKTAPKPTIEREREGDEKKTTINE